MELFKFENVCYKIDENKNILLNVNWQINDNENWVILGPNGSGKTTLLKMIYGFIRPNSGGALHWQNKKLPNLFELRKSIGFVSSFIAEKIPQYETVIDTVISGKFAMFGYWDYDKPQKQIVDEASRLLEVFGFSEFADRYFFSLSQGERQIIMLIRALMADPYLIVLDEPCSGLDIKNREKFLSHMNSIMNYNKNIAYIFVTHHIEEIIPLFEKILLLKEGRIIKSGDMKKILNSANLSGLFDIDLKVVENSGRYYSMIN